MNVVEEIAKERRARLAAEHLLKLKQDELFAANAELSKHALALTGEIVEQREEVQNVQSKAKALEGEKERVLEDLENANEAINIAERRLWDSVETIEDGFAVFDSNDALVAANSAYLSVFDGLECVAPGISYFDVVRLMVEEGIVDIGQEPAEHWVQKTCARWRNNPLEPTILRLWNGQFIKLVDRRSEGGDTVSLAPYGTLARHGEPAELKNFFILHEGVVGMADGELTELDYSAVADFEMDPRDGSRSEIKQVEGNGWIGFTDHYWMSTLIPAPGQAFRSAAKYDERRDIYQTDVVLPTMTLAAGETAEVTTQLFSGAKEWATIRAYEKGGIAGFLDSIDWGWFFFLTKPMFAVLHFLHGLIGNMGWAIIALTVLIKILVFPLAYKSYASMAKMKELQPEMEKLKERAGDDRQKQQKEIMELYKREKVNPAAGCLPILIQIPIFFSLYKVIFVTLELRHAAFFGPFQDLSSPDPTSIMNFFGLLPMSGPEAGTIFATVFIGILPILLGISMWLQQKLNPAPTDPTQQMIFAWMPWVFMFMLGGFASGLVVYWIANNTITFTQQYLIMRSHGFKPDVFGNIKASVKRKPKAGKE